MSSIIFLFFFLNSLFLIKADSFEYVTCGSLVKLSNNYNNVRLHSHTIKYGTGSAQQSVTGTKGKEDVNSYWLIKGLPEKSCTRGERIKCGQKLRLEHLETKKNLHSHLFKSPMSDNHEISCFGKNGEGDSGDIWTLVCDDEYWKKDSSVRFEHVDTDVWLSLSGRVYDRPIHGQFEVVGLTYSDSKSYWKIEEGAYIKEYETNKELHDEL